MREYHGHTGHLFEHQVLGPCLWQEDGYLPFKKALEQVKRSQSGEPHRPSSRIARTLHRQVALALGVGEWNELSFYTAVGSPLDYYHGIDAFLEWQGCMVTIDVTMNPDKTSGKADLIFHDGDDIDAFALLVAETLVTKRASVATHH